MESYTPVKHKKLVDSNYPKICSLPAWSCGFSSVRSASVAIKFKYSNLTRLDKGRMSTTRVPDKSYHFKIGQLQHPQIGRSGSGPQLESPASFRSPDTLDED